MGEGGPKGRMRVDLLPSPAASRHPLPKGEGLREKQVSIFEKRLQTVFSLGFMILFPEGQPTHRETFKEYCSTGGYQPITRNILDEVIASGLRGRGGAGFPVGKKWSIAAETPADTRYVVCNAGEDEPGSFKDRLLLEHRPHLVLEGLLLAARAIRATEAFLYLNETYDECHRRFSAAIEEVRPDVKLTIHRAPTVYVAGEDSATLEVLEGKPPKPRQKPPYPATAGL